MSRVLAQDAIESRFLTAGTFLARSRVRIAESEPEREYPKQPRAAVWRSLRDAARPDTRSSMASSSRRRRVPVFPRWSGLAIELDTSGSNPMRRGFIPLAYPGFLNASERTVKKRYCAVFVFVEKRSFAKSGVSSSVSFVKHLPPKVYEHFVGANPSESSS